MASEKVYKSTISGISILCYREREPKEGENIRDIPFVYLLVWNSTTCGKASFSSFFEAWSAVQDIDREHLKVVLEWDQGKNVQLPGYPENDLLPDVLASLGINDALPEDYDLEAILSEIRAEMRSAMTSRVQSTPADGSAGLEETSTVGKKPGL